jgi:hypothetical protein
MTKQKIFFSYSRADGSAFAVRLATDLKNKGFDVWIDQQDVRAGLEWDTEIQKALESCDCLLFLETEKSVVSNNVLDEVYYALEQNKKVIPLIYVDSRTPFRLHRLQHIDFTKDYDKGLAQLEKELESGIPPVTYQPKEKTAPASDNKVSPANNYRSLLIIGGLALLTIAVILLARKNEPVTLSEARTTSAVADTITNKKEVEQISPVTDINKEQDRKMRETGEVTESKKKNQGKQPPAASVNVNTGPVGSTAAETESNSNMNELVAGDWRLTQVEPKPESQRGYLKIEALGENKATIKSYMQFYYPDSKASSHLTIFNAFAGCTSCAVNKEMKLNVEDIAVGSRTTKKLEEDQADGRKAGEIVLDANSNKSIRGTITLAFIDNSNAVIKVKQPLTIELANELMLEPFEYTFRFKKND